MTPDQARDVVADASRSLTPETDIDSGAWENVGCGAIQAPEAAEPVEGHESLEFLTFVENVIERTWRSADADFGVCVELRRR